MSNIRTLITISFLIAFTCEINGKCLKLWYNKCKENEDCCTKYCEKKDGREYGFCGPELKNKNLSGNKHTFRENPSDTNCFDNEQSCQRNASCCSSYCEKQKEWTDGTCKSISESFLRKSIDVDTVTKPPIERRMEIGDCGVRDIDNLKKILGGEHANPKEYPWMVSLQIVEDGEPSHICGGSIIDKRWILTAAHCFYDENSNLLIASNIHIVTNVVDLKDSNKKTYLVEKYILHPKYDQRTFDKDIALVKLKSDIKKMTSTQYPICLPEDIVIPDQLVEIAGWGHTRHQKAAQQKLKKAFLKTQSRRHCRNLLPTVTITKNMICADGDGVNDTCKGDSGGPLMKETDQSYKVYGIVSFGHGCGQLGKPGLYTNVYNFVDWIQDMMKNF